MKSRNVQSHSSENLREQHIISRKGKTSTPFTNNTAQKIMSNKSRKLFTIGYADNTMTDYILGHFIRHGVIVNGAIFLKSPMKRSWRRLRHKIKARGFKAAFKRTFENQLIRKKQISQIIQNQIDQVFFVDKINSVEVRDILTSNKVELLILTSTPIIKSIILDIEGLTILNAHTGWLPRYRGLDANIKAMRDRHPLGISVHRVTKKIDGGEIYLREKFDIDPKGDILRQMDEKELELCGKLLVEAVRLMNQNKLNPIAQFEPLGKYEPCLTKDERNRIIRNVKRTL